MYSVAILLLLALIYLHVTSGDHNFITKGTTIIIWVDEDSIILAADSKVTMQDLNSSQARYSVTSNKISQLNKYFVAVAGLNKIRDKRVFTIIEKYYNSKLTIKQNSTYINEKLREEFQSVFSSLTKAELDILNTADLKDNYTQISIVGYEGNIPVTCFLNFRVDRNDLDFKVVTLPPEVDTATLMLYWKGKHDHILKSFDRKKFVAAKKVDELCRMIAYQASLDPDVGSTVNYVIIKPSGHAWGKKVP